MGCPGPQGFWTAAPCPGASTAHAAGPLKLSTAARQTGTRESTAPCSHRLTGEPQTRQCVLSHGTGALVPRGRACRGHSQDPHAPSPERAADSKCRAEGSWPANLGQCWAGQTPKGQHGEARQHCRSGAWTLPWRQGWPWDRQHGGYRAGRGLGP